MPTLRQPLAGIVTDSRRKPDAIFSSRVVSGNADFFSVSSLTLTLEADSTDPFVYDIGGSRFELQADKTLSVTDDAHNFIYIDNTGTLGRSALPCVYDWTAPASPASGQHWYDLGKSQMKSWNGSSWDNVSRIFIGYVRADSGSINARYACEPIGISPLDRYHEFGDGSDGFLDVSSGTTTLDGWYQYTAVVVRGTGTLVHVTVSAELLALQCQSAFVVLVNPGVNLDGLGTSGGSGNTGAGSSGNGAGEGGAGGGGGGGTNAGGAGGGRLQRNRAVSGGAGTAGAAAGGAGGSGNNALSSLGPAREFTAYFVGCSGGGGGGSGAAAGGNGGASGGSIQVKAPVVATASGVTLTAVGSAGTNGPAANRGAGGGGGGGTFTFYYRNLFQSGSFNVAGGSGGSSGGAGSGAGGNGGTGRTSLFQV
jgi:hypothetical protein